MSEERRQRKRESKTGAWKGDNRSRTGMEITIKDQKVKQIINKM